LKILSALRAFQNSGKLLFRLYALFFLTYYFLLFLAIPQIRNYESSAWRMIVDRLIANQEFGKNSFGNLLVIYPERFKESVESETQGLGIVSGRNMLKLVDNTNTIPEIYTSQFGLIGEFASSLQTYFDFSIFEIYIALTCICILFSSLILAKVCIILRDFLGKGTDVLFALCYLGPWAAIFAMNFYYFMFVNLLFMVIPTLIHEFKSRKIAGVSFERILYTTVFSLTLLFTLTNYTYVSVWVSCLVIGLLIVSTERLIVASVYIKSLIALSLGAGSALILHLIKVSEYARTLKEVSWIEYILRNKIGITGSNIPSEYALSTSKSPFDVVHLYLKEPLLNSIVEEKLHLSGFTINGYTLLIMLSIVICFQKVHRDTISLYVTNVLKLSFISSLGPLTWILIMRPHSWDNVQVNYIFVFMPFVPIVMSVLLDTSDRFNEKICRIRVEGIFKIALAYFGLIILTSWLIYFLSQR